MANATIVVRPAQVLVSLWYDLTIFRLTLVRVLPNFCLDSLPQGYIYINTTVLRPNVDTRDGTNTTHLQQDVSRLSELARAFLLALAPDPLLVLMLAAMVLGPVDILDTAVALIFTASARTNAISLKTTRLDVGSEVASCLLLILVSCTEVKQRSYVLNCVYVHAPVGQQALPKAPAACEYADRHVEGVGANDGRFE